MKNNNQDLSSQKRDDDCDDIDDLTHIVCRLIKHKKLQ